MQLGPVATCRAALTPATRSMRAAKLSTVPPARIARPRTPLRRARTVPIGGRQADLSRSGARNPGPVAPGREHGRDATGLAIGTARVGIDDHAGVAVAAVQHRIHPHPGPPPGAGGTASWPRVWMVSCMMPPGQPPIPEATQQAIIDRAMSPPPLGPQSPGPP